LTACPSNICCTTAGSNDWTRQGSPFFPECDNGNHIYDKEDGVVHSWLPESPPCIRQRRDHRAGWSTLCSDGTRRRDDRDVRQVGLRAHAGHKAVVGAHLGNRCWMDMRSKYDRDTMNISKERSIPRPFPFDVTCSRPVQQIGAACLCFILLCSCQLAMHEAHASATKWEKDTNFTFGGTTHTTGADGWDNATDHNASFQVAAQAAGVALGSYVAYLTQKSADLTSQLANTNLTSLQKAQLQTQLATTQANLAQAVTLAKIAKAPVPVP